MDTVSRKRNGRQVFWILFAAYASSYVGRKAFGACMADICASFEMTKTTASYISTAFLASYGIGQIVSGFISDRLSPKLMISMGLFGAGIANAAMAVSVNPLMMILFWCINGACHSMMWAPVLKGIASWIPSEQLSDASVNIAASIPAGTLCSYFICVFCLRFMDWHFAFIFSGLFQIAMGAVWLAFCNAKRDYMSAMSLENGLKSPEHGSGSASGYGLWFCIFGCGLTAAIFGAMFNGILNASMPEWIPAYFTEYYGIDSSLSALLVMALPVFSLVGPHISRFCFRHFGRNEMIASAMLFGSSAAMFGLMLVTSGVIIKIAAVALVSAFMLGVNNQFLSQLALNFVKIKRSGTVSGFLNAFCFAAASLSSVISGNILDRNGWDALILFWLFIALAGVPICIIGAFSWKKGRKKIQAL